MMRAMVNPISDCLDGNGLTIQARDAAYITYRAFSGDLQSGHSVRALARSSRRIPENALAAAE
jgi:hypothetical protein